MTLIRFKASQEQDADLSITYDAVVVGSGAAGGMAAHVLTSQGMKVLLLEAGKKIDINAELRSMEWPYDHPRRGEAPPRNHAIRLNACNIPKPPSRPSSPAHRRTLPHLPDSLFQRPNKLTAAEVKLRKSLAPMGRTVTPYRAGVTTDGVKNKYRSKCFGRGACGRRPGGCDIHAAFDSPTGLIYPAMDTGNLTLRTNSIGHEVLVDPNTGKAPGISFVDAVNHRTDEAKARGGI